VKIFWKSLVDFFRHDGPIFAGSIACFFMMSLVPFLLLIVSVFGYLLGENREIHDFLLKRLADFFPRATHEISSEIGKIITYRGIGFLTMGIYIYFSYQLYYSLERSVNIVFGLKEKRPPLVSVMLSLFVITLVIIFITVSFGAASVIPLLDYLARFLPVPKIGEVTRVLIRSIVPVLLTFLIVSALYVVLLQKKIRLRHALAGATFTAVFLEAAKHIFTLYAVTKVSQLGNIYGSLTTVVIFLLWIFYAACIFLIGFEVVHNMDIAEKKPDSGPER